MKRGTIVTLRRQMTLPLNWLHQGQETITIAPGLYGRVWKMHNRSAARVEFPHHPVVIVPVEDLDEVDPFDGLIVLARKEGRLHSDKIVPIAVKLRDAGFRIVQIWDRKIRIATHDTSPRDLLLRRILDTIGDEWSSIHFGSNIYISWGYEWLSRS